MRGCFVVLFGVAQQLGAGVTAAEGAIEGRSAVCSPLAFVAGEACVLSRGMASVRHGRSAVGSRCVKLSNLRNAACPIRPAVHVRAQPTTAALCTCRQACLCKRRFGAAESL